MRARGIPATAALLPLCLSLVMPAAAAAEPPERVINLIVYGDDACPKAEGDEIVVCGRRPESDRYRIPKSLREKEESGDTSWASRVEALDNDMRFTRPNSCSVVGSGGQTGCTEQLIRQWRAERRGR